MLHRIALAILIFGFLLAPALAQQDGARIALVIVNGKYQGGALAPLQNVYKDGDAIAASLKTAGFEVLPIVKDADQGAMRAAINAFGLRLRRAGPGATAFVYFSGHGAAYADRGENYLIPTGADIQEATELPFSAVALGDVIRVLDTASPKASFVVVDACRDVAFRGTKGGAKGMVPVAPTNGMIVGFATRPGTTAADNHLFAKELSAAIITPGLDAHGVFKRTQQRVAAASGNVQIPEIQDLLLSTEFQFGKAAVAPTPTSPAPVPTGSAIPSGAAEVVRICREVEQVTSLTTLGVLERQHRGTPAADCISAQMVELMAAQTAALLQLEETRNAAEAEAFKRKSDVDREKSARERTQPPTADFVIRKSAAGGGKGGEAFDDQYVNLQHDPITGFNVTVTRSVADRNQMLIGRFQVLWGDTPGPIHGGGPADVPTSPVKFDKGETIRRVVIFHKRFTWPNPDSAPVWVSGLQVRTSKGVYTFGHADGTAIECVPVSGEQIIGFFGRAGSYIDQLGCLFSGRVR